MSSCPSRVNDALNSSITSPAEMWLCSETLAAPPPPLPNFGEHHSLLKVPLVHASFSPLRMPPWRQIDSCTTMGFGSCGTFSRLLGATASVRGLAASLASYGMQEDSLRQVTWSTLGNWRQLIESSPSPVRCGSVGRGGVFLLVIKLFDKIYVPRGLKVCSPFGLKGSLSLPESITTRICFVTNIPSWF